MRSGHRSGQFDYVEDEQRNGDHHALAGLQAVYAGHDVDAVRAEDDDHHHEQVVERTEIHNEVPRFGQHHVGYVVVAQVDGQDGQRGDERKDELLSPSQIQNVVHEAEHQHAADAQQGGQHGVELGGGREIGQSISVRVTVDND